MPRSSQSRPQCAQIADHLAQNTPNSLNFTEVVCTLGASIPNTANMETAARPTGLPQRPWATEPGRTSETTHRSASFTTTPQVWRAPEGPEGLAGLRGAAPNEVRLPSLAGGRTLRRPEHQRGLAALPVGGGRAWPDNEPTHRTTRQQPAPPAWRAPEGPEGTGSRTRRHLEYQRGLAAVPVGGGARPDNEPTRPATHSDTAPPVWRAPEGPDGQTAVPVGGGRAWPGNEPTRRAKLAARTAGGRAAAHGHTKQPSRDSGRVQSPARGTRSHVRPQLGTPRPTARSPAHSAQASYIDESAHPCRGGRF